MKLLSLLLAVLLLIPAPALAEEPVAGGRVLLLLAWRDPLSTDTCSIGALDDLGGLWRMEMQDDRLKLWDQPLEWMAVAGAALAEGGLVWQGNVPEETLSAAVSLAEAVQDTTWTEEARYEGAGQLQAGAYRYPESGPEGILLALAGDICAEDTDENAQALFSLLMDLFPDLAEPAAQSQTLPEGFLPIPLLEFCGWMEDIPEDALIFASEKLDGVWTPVAEYEEKLEALLDNADEMVIVGKQSALVPEDGLLEVTITDAREEPLVTLQLYQGYLVTEDGQYRIGIEAE